jgi:hypothetical protein
MDFPHHFDCGLIGRSPDNHPAAGLGLLQLDLPFGFAAIKIQFRAEVDKTK